MKISFEQRILLGFIINLGVIFGLAWAYTLEFDDETSLTLKQFLNNVIIGLLIVSTILLTVVYFIIRKQFRAKNLSENLLFEHKQLLQSIIDNTSSPIFIKKLNGEYIFVNKECEKIFQNPAENLIGKTDYDFLPKEVADIYRDSDFEVIKAMRELKTEETIQLPDGKHTYIAIKFPIYDSSGRIYAIGAISTDITQRKTAEESLKAADKFFNMNLDVMTISSYDRFVKINPTISQILGYTEKELLSESYLKFIHPDDVENTKKELNKLEKGMPTVKFENRWIAKDGSVRWLVWAASPDTSSNLLYAVAHDITERKNMEDSLKMADNFFNMSFDAMVVGKGDHFIKINPAFTKTFGYTQEDMDKTPFYTLSSDPERSLNALKKLKEIGDPINFVNTFKGKDGVTKWVDWNTSYDKKSDLYYGVCRDVTQMKNDEEKLTIYAKKLEEDEREIEAIFEAAPDPVIVIDVQSRIIRWNSMAEKTFGWQKSEVIGKPIWDFIMPERYRDSHKKGMIHFIETGNGPILYKPNELEALKKDGAEFPVSLNVSTVSLVDGTYFIGFIRDITENKKMIEELNENEETLRLIIDNIGEGVIVANANKEIVLTNEMAQEIFEVEEIDNTMLDLSEHFQLYYPDERTTFPSQYLPMEMALDGQETNNVDVVLWNPAKQNKKRVLISGRPLIDQNNNVVAAVVTIKDISRYKQMENDLKETESKYRQLIGFRKSPPKDNNNEE